MSGPSLRQEFRGAAELVYLARRRLATAPRSRVGREPATALDQTEVPVRCWFWASTGRSGACPTGRWNGAPRSINTWRRAGAVTRPAHNLIRTLEGGARCVELEGGCQFLTSDLLGHFIRRRGGPLRPGVLSPACRPESARDQGMPKGRSTVRGGTVGPRLESDADLVGRAGLATLPVGICSEHNRRMW